MRQVLSDPALRSEFFRAEEVQVPEPPAPPQSAPLYKSRSHAALPSSAPPRPGALDDVFQDLDRSAATRDKQRASTRESDKIKERSRLFDLRKSAEAFSHPGGDRPAWTYCDPPMLVNPVPYERDTSKTCNKTSGFLGGIYDTPEVKPPHWEKDVLGAWNPTKKTERADGLFGSKARHRMGPTELVFADRLDGAVRRIEEQEHQDTLAKTVGHLKKQVIEATAEPHSSLNRGQQAWVEQRVATWGYFSTPDPYKPGEQHYDEYLTTAIWQPWRTTSMQRNFITCRDGQTNHWKQPQAGYKAGTAKKLKEAERLCTPSGVRKQRLEEKRRRQAERAQSRPA